MKKRQNVKTKPLKNEEYFGFVNMVEESIERDKNKVVKEILQRGDELVEELTKKRKEKNSRKVKMINYILDVDYPNNTQYVRRKDSTIEECKEDLINAYTYQEIKKMYDTLKRKNRTFFQKVKDLFTNKK